MQFPGVMCMDKDGFYLTISDKLIGNESEMKFKCYEIKLQRDVNQNGGYIYNYIARSRVHFN